MKRRRREPGLDEVADSPLALICSFLTVPEASLLLATVRRPRLVVPWTRVPHIELEPAARSLLKVGLLTHLLALDVVLTEVNSAAVSSVLAGAPNLAELCVTVSRDQLQAFDHLFEVSGVRKLRLDSGCSANLFGTGWLKQQLGCFPGLRSLDLSQFLDADKVLLDVVVGCCPALSDLSLSMFSLESPEDLLVLRSLKDLESCYFLCSSLAMLRCIQDFPQLRTLTLGTSPPGRLRLPESLREFRFRRWSASEVDLSQCNLERLESHVWTFLNALALWPDSVAGLVTLAIDLEISALDECARALSTMEGLKSLSLYLSAVPVCFPCQCPSVRSLTLDGLDGSVVLESGSLSWLGSFPNMVDLCFESWVVGRDLVYVEAFEVLPKLQSLVENPDRDGEPVVTVGRTADGSLVKCWADQKEFIFFEPVS